MYILLGLILTAGKLDIRLISYPVSATDTKLSLDTKYLKMYKRKYYINNKMMILTSYAWPAQPGSIRCLGPL